MRRVSNRNAFYHSSVVHSEQGNSYFKTKDGIVSTMAYRRAKNTHAFSWYGTAMNTFFPPRYLRLHQETDKLSILVIKRSIIQISGKVKVISPSHGHVNVQQQTNQSDSMACGPHPGILIVSICCHWARLQVQTMASESKAIFKCNV